MAITKKDVNVILEEGLDVLQRSMHEAITAAGGSHDVHVAIIDRVNVHAVAVNLVTGNQRPAVHGFGPRQHHLLVASHRRETITTCEVKTRSSSVDNALRWFLNAVGAPAVGTTRERLRACFDASRHEPWEGHPDPQRYK